MGNNHGVAICEWDPTTHVIEWKGTPTEMTIPDDGHLSLHRLTNAVTDSFFLDTGHPVIIGVDAPLGYPKEFVRFINGGAHPPRKPQKDIHNPLAYRYTDQVIHEALGKKPMSAAFDRIGNNTTVAIQHTRMWEENDHFKVYPMAEQSEKDSRIIIEVYPALVKKSKTSQASEALRKYLPAGIRPGTDAYDASICALYAIAYGTNGALLPKLVHPPEHANHVVKKEGWIYYFGS
ncbi:Protein of unknown function [Natribacillus halophilus]|uniref:DUF429 domain-containing protein n=2 Tax=Natribacillus halophilus TaxID=549003 RepID=A0A1G8J672_9BACI|nr:Protein of unknown function [Natribacillus halophilus]